MSDIPLKSRVRRGTQGKKNGGTAVKSFKSSIESDSELFDESEQCIICAERIIYPAFTPCQHVTCHRCALRQRILYDKTLCLVCRTPNDTIIIADDVHKDYNQFAAITLIGYNDEFKISFINEYVKEHVIDILSFKCSLKDCKETFESFKKLQDHIKQDHNRFFCLICYNYKKAFIDELPLYYYKALQTHQTVGDVKGFNGHPACRHCIKKRFYSEDELNVHIRDNHERCFICDQDHPATADYYRNYDTLYEHFKSDHYVCTIESCLEKKFVVFRDDIDLTAHMIKEHGNLTGNNRAVIGAGRFYQSQLSTYQAPRNQNSNNRLNEQNNDSFAIKKLRLEERAKHYLKYDEVKLAQFLDLNVQYKDNKVNADELCEEYKKLFIEQSTEEIMILLTENSELYPVNNVKRTKLSETITKLEKNNARAEFPILGGRAKSPTVNLHAWGGTSGNNSRNSSNEKFPVLQKPPKQKSQVQITEKPIRYTTVVTNSQAKKQPVNINTFTGDLNFKPTYLESSSSSGTSTPKATSGNWSSSNGKSKSATDLSKFPPLEKQEKAQRFGRVNPIQVLPSLQWGPSAIASSSSSAEKDDWGIPVTFKKKLKSRK